MAAWFGKSLSRRTFLRGAGVTLGVPMLDAMVPALAQGSYVPTPRLGFFYVGNGIVHQQWKPTGTGRSFEFSRDLLPLQPLRDSLTIITGLDHAQAENFGDGTGDHPRSSAAWLTGVHAWDRTQPGVETVLAQSADQIAAEQLSTTTRLRSLELSVDTATQSACDSGDCFYVNTVSWRNETTPNLTENHPRVVFERLFGDGGSAAQRAVRTRKTSSILDSVSDEATRLLRAVGHDDRTKLSEYLESVREIEQRIASSDSGSLESVALPARPTMIPDNYDEHTRLMMDLLVLAYQTDATRIGSMILAREVSNRTYPQIGVPDTHHVVSHHRNDPELMDKKGRIDAYHVSLLGYAAQKMAGIRDGEGSLLDNSLLLYGGGMGDGNLHRHSDLPCAMLGTLGGQIRAGRHIAAEPGTPMTNLLLSVLDKVGVHVDSIGDSTGRLDMDAAANA